MVLEKTLESPLDCKEIQPVHPKGDQSWMFIGRSVVEAEAPVLWLPDVKVKSLSCVWLFGTPRTVAYQVPPSMGFSRHQYWSGLPFPSLGIFLTQGSNPGLPHCRQTLLLSEPPVKKNWLSRKKPWCWERLKAGGKGDDRGCEGWIASLTRWTRVWASSRSCDGQGSLACYSPWGRRQSDTTEWLNSNNNFFLCTNLQVKPSYACNNYFTTIINHDHLKY